MSKEQVETHPHTAIQIDYKDGEHWRGYLAAKKGAPINACFDRPIAIGPGGESYGIKFEDITGPGEYTAPD